MFNDQRVCLAHNQPPLFIGNQGGTALHVAPGCLEGALRNGMIYHLVMTNSLPWKDPPFLIGKPSINHGKSPFLIGKPSISMGHVYHGYVK